MENATKRSSVRKVIEEFKVKNLEKSRNLDFNIFHLNPEILKEMSLDSIPFESQASSLAPTRTPIDESEPRSRRRSNITRN